MTRTQFHRYSESSDRRGLRRVARPGWLALVCASLLSASTSPVAAAAGDDDYEDWWLCANECAPDDAACVDKCTEEYNELHDAGASVLPLKLKLAPAREPIDAKKAFIHRCPKGTHLAPFDMPIYDRKGLFVVGYETVWMCLPDNLEPAG